VQGGEVKKKGRIKMTSRLAAELGSHIEIGGQEYLVLTENARPHIITKVYLGGKVLSTMKLDYSDILDSPGLGDRVQELLDQQHRQGIKRFKEEKMKEMKAPSEYLEEVKGLLVGKDQRGAIGLLAEALEQHPGDPFLLSYYGCLDAVVDKNYKRGIEACKKAIKGLKDKLPFGEEFYYPSFYLNLGRAYLAAGKKKEAIKVFNRGLRLDGENADLLGEMRKLGIRKRPSVSFLDRSSPINKYIGMLLHKIRK
jgi:tetratricopeptide (TPR) repeat protein